ncbi:hypothetical protein ACS0TY_027779 [Phlomoides rotata]
MGVMRLELVKSLLFRTGINPKVKSYYLFDSYAHLFSGLACGIADLAASMAIKIFGDAVVR